MALIIEELNHALRVQARHRLEGGRLAIGRGYDNDLILEDPHADASHAEVVCGEDGSYRLRDLGSVNGTRLLGNARDRSVRPRTLEARALQSGDEIQIGKSRLRFIDSHAEVAPPLRLHSLEKLFHKFSHPPVALGLLLAVIAVSLWFNYLAQARDYQWSTAVNLVTGVAFGLLLYAALWAFIGRVVRHEARFFTHLSVAALGALAFAGWDWFKGLLGFNFSMENWLPLLSIAALALLLPALLWAACFLALNFSPRWRLLVALLLPWSFLGLATADHLRDLREFSALPPYSAELRYSGRLWRPPVPMREFIASSPALFDIPLDKDDNGEPDSEDADAQQTETQQ